MGKLTVGSNPTVSAMSDPAMPGSVMPGAPLLDIAMTRALELAVEAGEHGEVPVGAVALHDGAIIAERRNERQTTGDPTAHAEVLALRDAAAALGRWRLDDVTMVVTLEPCPMCAGALWSARIGAVAFGAFDMKAGSLTSLYGLGADPRLNWEFPTLGGVRQGECAALLSTFFASLR